MGNCVRAKKTMLNAARQCLLRLVALAAFAFVAPAMAENCAEQKGKCFGVNWNTVSPAEIKNKNINVNARDEKGKTPLFAAALWSKNSAVIKILIQNDANISARDEDGKTALHFSAQNENLNITEILLRNGANISVRAGDWTPLHMAAAFNKNSDVTDFLIRKGAYVNNIAITTFVVEHKNEYKTFTSKKLNTVMSFPLTYKTTVEIIKPRMSYNTTPLHVAAEFNNQEVVPVLLKHGANVHITNNRHKTALHLGKENPDFYQSSAYWLINDASFNQKKK